MAFKIPGRVEKRLFDEGQMVSGGPSGGGARHGRLAATWPCARRRSRPPQAALAELLAGSRLEENEAAKAAMEGAAHALADLEAGSRPQEIAAAEAAVAAAAAEMSRLQADLRRATVLFQRNTISAEEYDAARAAYDVAVQKHTAGGRTIEA